MFTGLIEDVGSVVEVKHQASGSRVTIAAKTVMSDLNLGDSIAVDGVCTTVVALTDTTFTFEATPETLSKTVLARYQRGIRVNLERPVTPTSRMGGHFVTGHVDGLARLVSKQPEGISWVMQFELLQPELAPYLIPKGSIAVSGISLTVNTVEGTRFSVAIIPHTLAHTNLDHVAVGDTVHIETDLLGKYVQRFLNLAATQKPLRPALDEAFLARHGFIPIPIGRSN